MQALADLHCHLDGSLRLNTALELAFKLGVAVPDPVGFVPGMGISQALGRFKFTLALLESAAALTRVACELCEDAINCGVTTLEIRFAPQLHCKGALAEAIDAVLEGIAGRAGLIVCGLFGEPPASLEALVNAAKTRRGVVGIDLAGAPLPEHRFGMRDYIPAFKEAQRAGLGRTVHAGEGRPPEEIRLAIMELGAQRIGHGTTLLLDPQIRDLVVERGVVIEACVTSNWHTGAIANIALHPLPMWLKQGVAACVCTDNTLFSEVTPIEEHKRVLTIPGMNAALLSKAIAIGHAATFCRTG